MIIYSGTRAQFTKDVFANVIEEKVLAELRQRAGHAVTRAEVESWKNSLQYMNNALLGAGIPDDAGVAIVELKLVGFNDIRASRICGSWTEEPAIIKHYLRTTGRLGHSIARSLKAPALYRLPESDPPACAHPAIDGA